MQTVGKKLREARELLGLDQKQVAKEIGISQRDLSWIETGKKPIVPKLLEFLHKSGVDMSSVFDPDLEVRLNSSVVNLKELTKEVENALNKLANGQKQLLDERTIEFNRQIKYLKDKLQKQQVLMKTIIEKVDKNLIMEDEDSQKLK